MTKVEINDMIYLKGNVSFESLPDTSILESALSQGLALEYSCKRGLCGICKVKILSGKTKEINKGESLNKSDQGNGYILTCCHVASSELHLDVENLSALKGVGVKTLPIRISDIKYLSEDIVEVNLRLPPSTEFMFLEGQYIDVIGPNSIRRSYSIASRAGNSQIKLIIKKVKGGEFSRYWFEKAEKNDLLRFEGPKGTFFLRNDKKPLVFLATGTGVAPIISILSKLEEDDEFTQEAPIYVFWGNRKAENFIWKPSFQKLKVDISYVLSGSSPEWDGESGYVQCFVNKRVRNLKEASIYACGSNEMIQSAKILLVSQGMEESNFFSDAFLQSY